MSAASEPYVHPDTQALLARMGVDFAGAPADPTVAQRREGLEAAAVLYGPALAAVDRIETVSAPSRDGPVPVTVYHPHRTTGGAIPLVVHIHGGGWVLGGPEAYSRIARAYCAAGECVVVDVDYRRAPEHKHPAALQDCLAALEWAAANAAELGADPGRIVVTGDSAGGHLAAAVCQLTEASVKLQIRVYPVTSASARWGFPSRQILGDGRYFLREFDILRAEIEYFAPGDDREQAPASPVLATAEVLARQPPTVVFTASLDPLVDEGRAYVEAIRRAGGQAREVVNEGMIHGFVLFAGQITRGQEVIAEIGRLIKEVEA